MARHRLASSVLSVLLITPLASQAAEFEPEFALYGSWNSRHITEGVNSLSKGGIFWGEGSMQADALNAYIKVGRGDSVDFTEVDAGISYTLNLPLDINTTLGYERVQDWNEGERGHDNNLSLTLDYSGIEWLTPEVHYQYATSAKGAFLQFTLTGNWEPVDRLSVNPYLLEIINFGAIEDTDYKGLNNFEFGLNASYQLTEHVSVGAVASHSIAQANLNRAGLGDESYAGISFSWQ